MKKVFISLMLIIIMATNYTYEVHAEAATITVASGAIATGGLSTAGFAGLLTPCAVIVGVGLLACGVDVALTNASQSAGMTKTDFIKSKIQDFCNATNKTVGQFCKTILEGATIAKDGAIQLTDQASAQIKQLGEWLFSNDQVANPPSPNPIGSSVTIGNTTYPLITSCNVYYQGQLYSSYSFSEPVAVVKTSNSSQGCYYLFFSHDSYTVTKSYEGGSGVRYYSEYWYNNITGWFSNKNVDSVTIDVDNVPFTALSVSPFFQSLDKVWDPQDAVVDVPSDSFTGSRDDWASGSNALDPAQDKTTVLNPGLVQGLDIPGVNDLVSTVQDYLDALQEALDKVGTVDLPAIDTITGENVNVGVGEDTFDPAIDKEDNPDLPTDNTPVTDPYIPATGNPPINQNTIDLKGVFPFCIPFDIVDMIEMLNADPVAPRYTVNWPIPIINENLVFTVDLSPFNGVAEICRNMETILFCVGLALITRHLIRG